MAGNRTSPSQAEQAAKYHKNKKAAAAVKSDGGKKKSQARRGTDDPRFSLQGKAFVACLVLLILFIGMAVNPEGKVLQLIQGFLLGMFGKGAFTIAMFGLVYLLVSFGRKRPCDVKFKVYTMAAFVLLFGVLHHLLVNDLTTATGGLTEVPDFYTQGMHGKSGGIICGSVGFFLRWAFGKPIAILIVSLLWILSLLGVAGVTVPGVLRYLREMDRWDDDVEEEEQDPSQRVAMYLTDLHHQRHIRSRQRQTDRFEEEEEEPWEAPWQQSVQNLLNKRKKKRQSAPVLEPVERSAAKPARKPKPVALEPLSLEPIPVDLPELEPVLPKVEPDPAGKKVTPEEAAEAAAEVDAEIAKGRKAKKTGYQFPPMDLLKQPSRSTGDGTAEMKKNTVRLNETLESFKIDAHITNVTRGPSITRYDVELDKGVRLNKLTAAADDIALGLGVPSVRIAPVPGKISVVGIEVPNQIVTNVNLREVIDSKEFHSSNSYSSFAVGKDISGSCIVGNIAKMPHLLIAGTTGSGKSVCMNSIIISLLYKASPDDVKLIMVDPKMVELGIYNEIPHLLIPVVTDPKKAAGSLQWAVTEMMRRYKLMSDAGVRDLESFNAIVESQGEGEKMPQVVVIIDELADLMLVAAKEVEDSICRIAQMGRAAGMHLIIATQRPSADVITGLMKANIPSRIAFAVASAMESRIILDTQGAEKLVGRGDMLFAPIGTGKPQRVQGCFVSDAEVEAVVAAVKGNCKAVYDESVMDEIEKSAAQTGKKSGPDPEANGDELAGDELLPDAVDVILETGQASVSMLQRRLKLGYARAARIVDEMEEKGIVGPFQGSKPRTILITREQWAEQKAAMGYATANDIPFDLE